MLRFVRGNLFNSKAQTLVNPVNCVGFMGKGIALDFKKRYPDMYEEYRSRCDDGTFGIGDLFLYKGPTRWVLNFPTKRHYRSRSRLEDIETGLQILAERYREWEIESLALPALGCGHGGLEWSDVRPLIEKHLGPLDIDVQVFEPYDTDDEALDNPVQLTMFPDSDDLRSR